MDGFEAMMRQVSLGEGEDPVQQKQQKTRNSKPVSPPKPKAQPKPEPKEEEKKPEPKREPTESKEKTKADEFWSEMAGENATTETEYKPKKPSNRRSTKSLLSSRRTTSRKTSTRRGLLTVKKPASSYSKPKKTIVEENTTKSTPNPPTTATTGMPKATTAEQPARSPVSSRLNNISTGANNKYGGISSDKVLGTSSGNRRTYYDPSSNAGSSTPPAKEGVPEEDPIAAFGNYATEFFSSFQQ
mmetsp:Transcript_5703/g.10477  ORF Transcript_5703/g.10477 Transcript_5703/m.10477 type:complete len:243 (-) Transcript_5703:164-892(-)